MSSDVINFLYKVTSTVMQWWNKLINAVGLRAFWVGAVVIVMLFSIVFTSLRGGQLIGGGAIGSYAQTKINARRKSKKNGGG